MSEKQFDTDSLEALIRALIGNDGVEKISRSAGGWSEFDPFDEQIVEVYNDALELMKDGVVDLSKLYDLQKKASFYCTNFLKRVSFGKDQNNAPVSAHTFVGDFVISRPELTVYLAMKFLLLWVIEHKLNSLREDSEPRMEKLILK